MSPPDSKEHLRTLGEDLSENPTLEGRAIQPQRIIAGRYEILSQLGKGGMGEVWHAYDLKLRVDVALKSFRMDLKANRDPVEALRGEVRTAREVISPNVCRIFDLVVEQDLEMISMEFIDGITLTGLLVKKGPMEFREARDIAAQFLAGLEAIHQAGLVHRDFKPENIMITRTGRVVVMDFGIAKEVTQIGGTISGTPAYMSPEQLTGQKVDVRSDIFSAGVVLAEMIHPDGILSQKTREGIWNAVRKDPMQLPEGPWKAVIARAVATDPSQRFQSAAALSRALEEVTQRVETIEERKPYPGLASFSASDAEYFFGRELEVEALIKKLQQLHFMALIGPSGAGKTSMLRAGLIPTLPNGWSHVLCYPGDAPMVNLAQALATQLSGDSEVFARMVRFEEPDVALWILRRWKEKHSEALLIVDRFEELFTLNSSEVQSNFAELLGRAVLEADVRVLLVMRDDFLMFCHQLPSLAPIFSELSGLSPLSGASLRRALVQPALKCGYRFEDEELVDEILADVEKERGALPLMAFAAARLWENRDRESGELKRKAYKEIGGVAGALAQHAESTMQRIGIEREQIVREIFRNLITAQNTRVARDTDELLSVFPEKRVAEEVLRSLIDARLLTSFEAVHPGDEKPKSRVEIIHESLISNWPRLVRWQTQDVDSAQLRDQLRQAAQLWEQRNRSEDLLWTGTAYLEFQAWRQRYPGGLTATEEAFGKAMQMRATKRRRQQQIVASTIIIVLFTIVLVISGFWRRAEVARKNAVLEAQRAEAGKLLALGRGELEADPSIALAYALAATELADMPESRLFAMKALWNGPPAFVKEMPNRPLTFGDFSPDGKQLVVGGIGGVQLLSRDDSAPVVLTDSYPKKPWFTWPQFLSDNDSVIWRTQDLKLVRVWSSSQKKVIREFRMEGYTGCLARGRKAFLVTDVTGQTGTSGELAGSVMRSWELDEDKPKLIGHWNRKDVIGWDIDPNGKWLVYGKRKAIYIRSLDPNKFSNDKLYREHASDVTAVAFHPDGEQLATSDSSGEIRLGPFTQNSKKQHRVFFEKQGIGFSGLHFHPSGSLLAVKVGERAVHLRDLSASSETRSRLLYRAGINTINHVEFHPTEPWLVVVARENLVLYPLNHTYPYIYEATKEFGSFDIGFTPDGKSVVTGFIGSPIQLWQLPAKSGASRRNIGRIVEGIYRSAVDPQGKYILIASNGSPHASLISIQNGEEQPIPVAIRPFSDATAFSKDGKLAALSAAQGPPQNLGIEIFDVEKKSIRVLEKSKEIPFWTLNFSPDGFLFAGDMKGNLWQWDLNNNTGTVINKGKGIVFDVAVSPNGRYVAATVWAAKHLGEMIRSTSETILYDVKEQKIIPIPSHGNRVCSVAFDPNSEKLITGDHDGIIRVGRITDRTPHLLFGCETAVFDIAVDPSGKWIASAERGRGLARLWAMPQGPVFHALPKDEFLKRLRTMTNVRIVAEKNAPTGYIAEYAPFSGWKELPNW